MSATGWIAAALDDPDLPNRVTASDGLGGYVIAWQEGVDRVLVSFDSGERRWCHEDSLSLTDD